MFGCGNALRKSQRVYFYELIKDSLDRKYKIGYVLLENSLTAWDLCVP